MASGTAAATLAGRTDDKVEWQKTVPAAAAARATPSSPSGWARRWYAVGATSSGMETSRIAR